jgi:cytoskeletal protein CcmA (bactofilin family)
MTHIVATGNANISGAMIVNGQANVGNLSFPPTSTITVSVVAYSGTTVTVTTAAAHGLAVGNEVVFSGLTATTNAPNGIFLVVSTPSSTTFTFTAAVAPTGTLGFSSAVLTVRPLITSQGSGIFNGRLVVGGDATLGNIPSVMHITASGNVQAAFMSSANANVTSNLNVGGTANLNNVNMTGVLGTTGGANFGSGNAVFYANGQANLSGNIGAPHVFVSGNVEAGVLKSSGIMFATGNVTGGNLVTNGVLSVQGDASVGNITTKDVNGTSVTISGNVSGANLVASGILKVSGTANVGNLNLPSTLVGISSVSYSGTTITVTTSAPHTITVGSEITLTGVTTNGTNPPNVNSGGNPAWFTVTSVTSTTIVFTAAVAPTGTLNSSAGSLNVRPFIISAGSATYGGNLTATGNVVAGAFTGVGSGLTSLNASAITSGTISSSVIPILNQNTTGSAGTVSGASQPNITAVGQLLSLAVGGAGAAANVNLYANGTANFSGNLNASYISANGALLTSINGAQVSKVPTAGTADTAGTVSASAQPSITSVGVLTGLSISGSISSVTNITASGFVMHSAGVGITATGTTQGTATPLTKQINVITTSVVSTNDGVTLPAAAAGMTCIVINTAVANVKVYPASGGYVDGLAQNNPFVLGPGARLMFVATSLSQWYTMTAVYG